MKKITVFALAALSATGLAWGKNALSLDLTYATNYVFRGIELGDQTLHPSIEGSADDYYIGFWGALPIDHGYSPGRPDGWTNEYDFYAGYQPKISDKVSLDIGGTHYYYTQKGLESTTEGFVGVTGDVEGFTPGAYVYYDFDLKNLTIQGNLGYSIPLAELGTSLDLSATLGFVSVDVGEDYTYYGVGGKIPYKLNDNATVSFGLQWASNDLSGIKHDHLYATVGATIGF